MAVIVLDKPVPQIKPVTMESTADLSQNDYDGKTSVAIGWGSIIGYQYGIPSPPPSEQSVLLKKVNLPVISRQKCLELFSKRNPQDTFDYTFGGKKICVQQIQPEGTCQVIFIHFVF